MRMTRAMSDEDLAAVGRARAQGACLGNVPPMDVRERRIRIRPRLPTELLLTFSVDIGRRAVRLGTAERRKKVTNMIGFGVSSRAANTAPAHAAARSRWDFRPRQPAPSGPMTSAVIGRQEEQLGTAVVRAAVSLGSVCAVVLTPWAPKSAF